MTTPRKAPELTVMSERHELAYRDGRLFMEGVALAEIAAEVGTPVYCYSRRALERAFGELDRVMRPLGARICYAMKANGNLSVLKVLDSLGAGIDIVSIGEMERARAAGIGADRMVFSGVGKADHEIATALADGVGQFNAESAEEVALIATVARRIGRRAPVALRVNPDVDASTHQKISTGRKGDKFGIPIGQIPAVYRAISDDPALIPLGLAVHIGSQITSFEPYRQAYSRLAELVIQLRGKGLNVERLDLGGGIGIDYGAGASLDLQDFAAVVAETVGYLDCELTIEPGRRLVGEAGVLLTTVLYRREGLDLPMLVVDAGMNDLMRPALYDACHPAIPLSRPAELRPESCRIVGPICESSDNFGLYDGLPALGAGAMVAFLGAGADGASMASGYNARPIVPDVMVAGDGALVARRRQSVREQIELELRPQPVPLEQRGARARQAGA